MVPEKRAAFFERQIDYAHSRMVVGAHFPSDLEAGRLVGTVAAELLMQNPRFEHDLAAARASLRAELKLPPEPTETAPGG
jgi:acid phosphatase (class A)